MNCEARSPVDEAARRWRREAFHTRAWVVAAPKHRRRELSTPTRHAARAAPKPKPFAASSGLVGKRFLS
jgi:hypothetical protein